MCFFIQILILTRVFFRLFESGLTGTECIINTASSLLQQTSTTTSANKENVPKAGNVGAKRGPNPLPRDPVTGLIIKPVDSDGNSIVRTRITKNNAQ